MCKLIRWVLFTLAVLSCQPPLFDSHPRSGNPYGSGPGRAAAGKPEEPEPSGPQVSLYVVSCNGEERFRFPGEEVFNGFWVIDGQLYTLGQRPGGGGLCFRVNGQERFSSESGVLLNGPDEVEWDGGAFCIDSSGIYYTYRVPVRKQEEVNWEYRVMKEDQVEKPGVRYPRVERHHLPFRKTRQGAVPGKG